MEEHLFQEPHRHGKNTSSQTNESKFWEGFSSPIKFRLIIYLLQHSKKENVTSAYSLLEPEHVTKSMRLFKLCSKEVKASPPMQTVVFTEKRRKRSIPSPQSPLLSFSEAAAA